MLAMFFAVALVGQSAERSSSPAPPRWTLRMDPAYCRLEVLATGRTSTLLIDTIPGIDSYRLVIAGDGVRSEALAPATITFLPSGTTMEGLVAVSQNSSETSTFRMDGVLSALLDGVSTASSIAITGRKARATAEVPNAVKAVAAFRRCSDDQLVEWGADVSQFAPGGKTPKALKERDAWIPNSSYMSLARQSPTKDVDAVFRVAISEKGVIDDCRAIAGEVAEGVSKIACAAVINKHLFSPALNAAGAPVRGVGTFRITMVRQPS